ncbi:cytochrome c oxidase subunit II [Bradymonas sediminis]|uniref:Cytochrome c oxidase subunit 2 n=1 Tax=Bradymonas sediminis TaxID=1548548 RepID=A0A2Z4FMG0_9DELT|nr:c-type cytochrome [Bradymonas sediminis]AWV90143.1 hypothetical protein DN745_12690 [Bradymonas sediminis]TDP75890.1 cytochrome c oxidase subunit II-like protein [Bradymonas sediminis]
MSIHTNSKRPFKLLIPALVVLTAILVPMTALAIPGSGEYIGIHSGSGRLINELYRDVFMACLLIMVIVEGLLIFSILKFRRRNDDEQPYQNHGNMKLELGWTLAVIVLQIYLGFTTISVMYDTEVLPEKSMTVEAVARQWAWDFKYPEQGGIVSPDLIIPANTNITLEVTSKDVIHALFIPEMGVKIDAVPGRKNYYWFNADGKFKQLPNSGRDTQEASSRVYPTTRSGWWQGLKDRFSMNENTFYSPAAGSTLERQVTYLAGRPDTDSPYTQYSGTEYRGMCAETCGKDHWNMYFRMVAMTQSSFEQWVDDVKTGANKGEVDGAQLYSQSCVSCHGDNGKGTPGTFPPLAGTELTNEDSEDAKKKHVSIVLNGLDEAVVVQGVTYGLGQMKTQNFGAKFNDEELAAVVNHERTSWGNKGGTVDAEFVASIRDELGLPAFPAGGAEPVSDDELMAVGQTVYASCVSCHGQDGKGLESAPGFTGNKIAMNDLEAAVKALDNGLDTQDWSGVQPAMGKGMSDKQVAGVLTYIRKSFGNEGDAVQPAEVTTIREAANK